MCIRDRLCVYATSLKTTPGRCSYNSKCRVCDCTGLTTQRRPRPSHATRSSISSYDHCAATAGRKRGNATIPACRPHTPCRLREARESRAEQALAVEWRYCPSSRLRRSASPAAISTSTDTRTPAPRAPRSQLLLGGTATQKQSPWTNRAAERSHRRSQRRCYAKTVAGTSTRSSIWIRLGI